MTESNMVMRYRLVKARCSQSEAIRIMKQNRFSLLGVAMYEKATSAIQYYEAILEQL